VFGLARNDRLVAKIKRELKAAEKEATETRAPGPGCGLRFCSRSAGTMTIRGVMSILPRRDREGTMRVGVLEILTLPTSSPSKLFYHSILTKQFASVTPQAVSVWCRQLGHETEYAIYYGVGDPLRCLSRDLDVVFLACYTQASPLAYALSKIFRSFGVRTVLGGPHAKAFPRDALRFFDYVVKECDRDLIQALLGGEHAPGTVVSSGKPFKELPSVEERMPEIRKASLLFGRQRYLTTTVPLLSSVGCPYACNFCIDWNNPYRMMPCERLIADLQYVGKHLPGAFVAFHDPNFGVRFNDTLEALEAQPEGQRLPYLMESSLSILKPARIKRLGETNCAFVAPGIESWDSYSNKAGTGSKTGEQKVESVAEQLRQLYEYVPNLQANMIFGLDTDGGEAPVELTKRFMQKTPFVWPTLNIPMPFGGTPLFEEQHQAGRILEEMPFGFYYAPYTVTTIKNYDPKSYYRRLIEMFEYCSSGAMLRRRLKMRNTATGCLIDIARTFSVRAELREYRRILRELETDDGLCRFHEGKRAPLPAFYRAEYDRQLGRYARLLDDEERRPVLEQEAPAALPMRPAPRKAATIIGRPSAPDLGAHGIPL
jgi:radical SAM superfamily enzyme YgiQ (UPF0313 family)